MTKPHWERWYYDPPPLAAMSETVRQLEVPFLVQGPGSEIEGKI